MPAGLNMNGLVATDNPLALRRIPSWVSSRLGVPSAEVATIELPDDTVLHHAYLRFLNKHARDVSEENITNVDEVTSLMVDTVRPTRKSKMRDSVKLEPGFWIEDSVMVPKYRIGVGAVTLKVDNEIVYAIHYETGPPVGASRSVHTPRTLRAFALKSETLRTLTAQVTKEEYRPPRDLKANEYHLYTLELGACTKQPQWRDRGIRQGRSLESIILSAGQLEAIVQDFTEFSANDTRRWYNLHGLPYRRTYLFHGPPGVGKTSTIRALAGVLRLPACFLSLGTDDIGNRELVDAMEFLPKPSVLVIEDIESLFNEKREATEQSKLSFSGLLNALDGLVAADGILCVMTTNHPERLDPALTRAGRVDRRFEFSTPERDEIANLFKSYYPDAEAELAKEFAELVFKRPEKNACNIAYLQQHFIATRRMSAQESVNYLPTFFSLFLDANIDANKI